MNVKVPKLPPRFSRNFASLRSLAAACLLLNVTASAPANETPAPAAHKEDSEAFTPPPPATPQQVVAALERGVAFLLKDQNKDGSWGSPHQTKDLNIFAPVPGAHHAFRAAVSAMCVEALIVSGTTGTNVSAAAALGRGEAWLIENLPKVRRADGIAIYNVWTHAYGLQALAAMHGRKGVTPERQARLRELMVQQLDLLRRYESVDGGWGYYDFRVGAQRPATDSTSFVTATALLAFERARAAGVEIPADLRKRAVDSINRQRKPDHSYFYGEYLKWRPMLPINRPGGSLGRSQACNLALRLWGDKTITDEVLTGWLEKLITRNGWLDMGRKRPIPHESWFQVAGYFYYYGHYYGVLCAEELGGERGDQFKARLAGLLVALQEKDGSWWDYPLYNYHQQYGTAYAVMSLARCLPN
jgi:hypothetical protein